MERQERIRKRRGRIENVEKGKGKEEGGKEGRGEEDERNRRHIIGKYLKYVLLTIALKPRHKTLSVQDLQ